MKLSRLFGILALALLVTVTLGGNLTAQPFFTPASGCRESALLTTEQFYNPGTGAFTQDRTLNPGEETEAVLGAWVIQDGFVADPTAGVGVTPNCLISPADGNPTYVTKLVVRPVMGDPVAAGVKTITFWLDNNLDGFLTPGLDTQMSPPMDAACLTSATGCVLTFGNTPIFGGLAGLLDGAPGGFAGFIISANISNPKAGATLQVRAEAYASDIVNNPFGPFSSDFSPSYQKQASNVRLVIQGFVPGPGGGSAISPAVNNGSGNPETGVKEVTVLGIRTRDDRQTFTARDARPGDREYIVGLISLCDGGEPVAVTATILPPVAAATPTIAGGLGAIPCVFSAATDGVGTTVAQVRVGFTGTGAQFIQAVHVYVDADSDGALFEAGEMILSQVPVNNIAQVGSLQLPLATSGGSILSGAGIIPDLAGPIVFYVTVDIDDRATASDVKAQVALDVADVPGTISSRLLRTAPLEFNFQITGPAAPPPPPTTATLIATVGKPPKKPGKSMTYKDVFVSATGPAGASKLLTSFSVPGCTVSKVTGPALPQNVVVGGAPVGPFKVKVKCATKPGSVPVLTPLRVGGESDTGVPGLIPLKAGSVGTIEVFTLTGKKVLETGFSGGALDATKLDLPNGVYLYVVKTVTPEGVVRSELKKLVVLR